VLTTVIAVPLGVSFALGINRWRGYTASTFNFVMILSFVIPELIFGVAMFFVFTVLFTTVPLGTWAEVLGLVTWNVSWPAIIVQARLVTLGRQYEEAAADLGANRFETMRRVTLPLLGPAIFASAVLVFSGVIDDFVIVDLLSSSASNTPMSVIIYSTQHGGNGGPRPERPRHDQPGHVVRHRDHRLRRLPLAHPRRARQPSRGPHHHRRQRRLITARFLLSKRTAVRAPLTPLPPPTGRESWPNVWGMCH
jgi:ABC-type molybdate transport system permease subunit